MTSWQPPEQQKRRATKMHLNPVGIDVIIKMYFTEGPYIQVE